MLSEDWQSGWACPARFLTDYKSNSACSLILMFTWGIHWRRRFTYPIQRIFWRFTPRSWSESKMLAMACVNTAVISIQKTLLCRANLAVCIISQCAVCPVYSRCLGQCFEVFYSLCWELRNRHLVITCNICCLALSRECARLVHILGLPACAVIWP